jgi:hypothetical protein
MGQCTIEDSRLRLVQSSFLYFYFQAPIQKQFCPFPVFNVDHFSESISHFLSGALIAGLFTLVLDYAVPDDLLYLTKHV